MQRWTAADIPDQTGRTAVITGSNTGLGYETARALASHGASVVLAVRNLEKGQAAADLIARRYPGADVAVQELDLTSLASIRSAADELRAGHDHIDLLHQARDVERRGALGDSAAAHLHGRIADDPDALDVQPLLDILGEISQGDGRKRVDLRSLLGTVLVPA